ncbi:phosphatidylserine/phosphatidylglycerophosphate/cardiolipin synthase-like enzyme [Bradyrhizobium japonicum]|uniref:phospholipase D-like domain-containing protein n=1 Tax=Bradyrhizobium japonicum TaxID=375 RepID=UPI0009B649F5|nr:phospholipase D-like domain-containing protein [Bradyrhizobium japonicum]
MRVSTSAGKFKATAIAGTRAIMIALDCEEDARKGLLGFAFQRKRGDAPPKWLRSGKVFETVVPEPNPKTGDYRTNEFPIQSFLWSDYTAEPGTAYAFDIFPAYGKPGALQLGAKLTLKIKTEVENDGKHGIWFNRGAIASQAYAREFDNHKPTDQEMDDPNDKRTKWLSRGLLEAALAYIDSTKPGEALRACVYEFTYAPIIEAFKRKIDDGFDVRLIVHKDKNKDKKKDNQNFKAIKAAGLDPNLERKGERVFIERTRPPIPHNKYIIKLDGDTPRQVWTGSTNITPSGFLGQSNVGHLINDSDVASQYLKYWTILSDNPANKTSKEAIAKISPYPPALVGENSKTCVFSPRQTASMLNWYADRMSDATSSIMFTAAFKVADDFIKPLALDRDFLRFVLKEKPPTADERKALSGDRDLQISYGAVLGALMQVKDGKIINRRKVDVFPLEKWFMKEELTRSKGNIFFIHTKYLLIDPLSDDPLVCTGSANFSENSLTSNDENMILIRGDERVADIYMTEFDRLFRHFYSRDVINETAMKLKKGQRPEKVFLDEDDKWTDVYFFKGGFKSRRREMFFNIATPNWIKGAGDRANDEPIRPPKKKKAKGAAVKSKAVAKKSKAQKKSKTSKVKTSKTKTSKAKKSKAKTSKAKKKAKSKSKAKSKK